MSFDIALSGIQAINDSLDTTSHNIANAGTYGYKSSRANFSTLVAGNQQTGVMVGSITQNIGLQGGILNTGRALDASINGRGFFITKDATGETQYTRVGIFDASKDGYLIDASGRKVQGYAVDPRPACWAPRRPAIPTGRFRPWRRKKSTTSATCRPTGTRPAAGPPRHHPDNARYLDLQHVQGLGHLRHPGRQAHPDPVLRPHRRRRRHGPGTPVDVHYVLDGVDLAPRPP
jgi:flagellar hook protein FlgE